MAANAFAVGSAVWRRSLLRCRPLQWRHQSTTTSTSTDRSIDDAHPLKGLRVLDLTRIIAGPYCTMMLADLGAEVIKVERPFVGDEARKWGPPFLPGSRDAVYFLSVNRNKRSVCVDLKRGRDVIAALARESDVLVENFVPGKLAEFGLDYERLRAEAPGLVYCSLSGYGPVGPYAKRPGYDLIAASIGGLLHITGEREGPPSKVGVAMTDIATGLYAHGAILAALLQRARTGRGQKIDVNLLSTQVAALINVASNYLNGGAEAQRWGTAHSSIVPYQAFRTADGYLTVGTGSDDQFRQLCDLLAIPEVAADARFATNKDRVEHRGALVALLEEIFGGDTTANWMRLLADAPFPVGPVNTIGQVFADEHVRAIGLVKTLPHPTDGEVRVVGPPVVFSEARNDARTAPPTRGQHTDEVLRRVLGYSEDRIAELRQQRVIE